MTDPDQPGRNALLGGVFLGVAGLILLRIAGPTRLLALIFLSGGAFYLSRTDPKRLTAVLVVVALGFGYLAVTYSDRLT